jgi:hypothetical protein
MNETDRELLQFAAKAAGMDYLIWAPGAAPCVPREHRIGDRICWHPLTDDGDALRLAVKLGLKVNLCVTQQATQVGGVGTYVEINFDADPYAATRRAIVRAAAEIGRNMK